MDASLSRGQARKKIVEKFESWQELQPEEEDQFSLNRRQSRRSGGVARSSHLIGPHHAQACALTRYAAMSAFLTQKF